MGRAFDAHVQLAAAAQRRDEHRPFLVRRRPPHQRPGPLRRQVDRLRGCSRGGSVVPWVCFRCMGGGPSRGCGDAGRPAAGCVVPVPAAIVLPALHLVRRVHSRGGPTSLWCRPRFAAGARPAASGRRLGRRRGRSGSVRRWGSRGGGARLLRCRRCRRLRRGGGRRLPASCSSRCDGGGPPVGRCRGCCSAARAGARSALLLLCRRGGSSSSARGGSGSGWMGRRSSGTYRSRPTCGRCGRVGLRRARSRGRRPASGSGSGGRRCCSGGCGVLRTSCDLPRRCRPWCLHRRGASAGPCGRLACSVPCARSSSGGGGAGSSRASGGVRACGSGRASGWCASSPRRRVRCSRAMSGRLRSSRRRSSRRGRPVPRRVPGRAGSSSGSSSRRLRVRRLRGRRPCRVRCPCVRRPVGCEGRRLSVGGAGPITLI